MKSNLRLCLKDGKKYIKPKFIIKPCKIILYFNLIFYVKSLFEVELFTTVLPGLVRNKQVLTLCPTSWQVLH